MKKYVLKIMITGILILSLTSGTMAGVQDRQREFWLQDDDYYSLDLADTLIRLAERDPFCFEEFDQGYVTFVVDDLLEDLDSIASIFEEYGYPLVVAAIPSRMGKTANGLNEPRGSFVPGMSMKEIMQHVVKNGGEVMAHNKSDNIVTEETQLDYDFMYAYFVETRKQLEKEGFTVRGIMKAGGPGAVSGTEEIERWLIGNYDYSNMGTAENYRQTRITIQKSNKEIKSIIHEAQRKGEWVKFMVHGYRFGNGKTFRGEDDLRSILSYCKKISIPVVTYAYMFDTFGSSEHAGREKLPYQGNADRAVLPR